MTVFPGSEIPVIEQINNIEQHGFAQSRMNLLSHHGTHMDAPAHMVSGGKTLDQFGPEQFWGKAICLDYNNLIGQEIDIPHLKPFENQIDGVDFVLFHTGWFRKWETEEYFKDFPVLNQAACEWLSTKKLKGIGLDTISIDKMQSTDYENHMIVLGAGMLIIENLNNLDTIAGKTFDFFCFPIKYSNADGSTIRAIAVIKE
jgi:kynurenine formamidase